MAEFPRLSQRWIFGIAAAAAVRGSAGAGKKPLFEYDDHYVMLNDFGRNAYYERALERAVAACGGDCRVLDVGAGSGLLSMLAAQHGARHVVAIEANPSLAALAEATIQRNRERLFPDANVTVIAALSSAVALEQMPETRPADILVTETFGTMLLGEGAINFVPDARDRLLKPGGLVIPAGGCQYATLVEAPDFAAAVIPPSWHGLNMTQLRVLQDTLYWKASMGASLTSLNRLTERVCVLEVDLRTGVKEDIPLNRTFRVPVTRAGTVHAVLFDWDIWLNPDRSELLSTAPGSRNFAGDVAWGWLFQLQEEFDDKWQAAAFPRPLDVQPGEALEIGVDYLARGISVHVRTRRAGLAAAGGAEVVGTLPAHLLAPGRLHGVNRGDLIEASEFYLPVAGDLERHDFYRALLDAAVARNTTNNKAQTVLDCSGNAGVPALYAATEHKLQSVGLTRRNEFAKVLRQMAADNGVAELVEAYAADPRDMLDVLLPRGQRADIVVVDPPGTPLHGLSPFAVLPVVRQKLLKEGGQVVPGGACFELGLVESEDLAQMFSVPGDGYWKDIDLTVWNEEARRQGVLERLVPYTKWFGSNSSMNYTWLSPPQCLYDVDLSSYGVVALPEELELQHSLLATAAGSVHALVGRWAVFESLGVRDRRLGAESQYFGRALTWPHYVQAVASPGTAAGAMLPIQVQAGERVDVTVLVRNAAGKRTGAAGPEFAIRLAGRHAAPPPSEPGRGEL